MKTKHKVIGIILLLTIGIIAGGTYLSGKKRVKGIEEKVIINDGMMGEKMALEGDKHVARGKEHPAYKTNPPTSGYHWAGVAGAGIKDKIIPDELLLHSMEHGAVVVWYKQDLDVSDIQKIKDAFISASGKKIMVPRKDLDVPVALTSWGYLMKLDTINGEIIKAFIETNNDKAPEKAGI